MTSPDNPAKRTSIAARVKLLCAPSNILLVGVLGLASWMQLTPGGALRSRIDLWRQRAALEKRVLDRWADVQAASLPLTSSDDKSVDIVEFLDYECPYCRSVAPQLLGHARNGVKIGILHFPQQSHPLAMRAAEIAACEQTGQSSRSVNEYFLRTEAWRSPIPSERDAAWSGLTADSSLRACIADGRGLRIVRRHIAMAESLGVRGTPTFVSRWGVVSSHLSDLALDKKARR